MHHLEHHSLRQRVVNGAQEYPNDATHKNLQVGEFPSELWAERTRHPWCGLGACSWCLFLHTAAQSKSHHDPALSAAVRMRNVMPPVGAERKARTYFETSPAASRAVLSTIHILHRRVRISSVKSSCSLVKVDESLEAAAAAGAAIAALVARTFPTTRLQSSKITISEVGISRLRKYVAYP